MTGMHTANKDRVMATIGMFDGVHTGHRALIAALQAEAATRGMEPCLITFKSHPLETVRPEAAPALLMSTRERLATLHGIKGLKVVALDFTPELRRLTARQFMQSLHNTHNVDALLLGFNHRFGSDRLGTFEQYELLGRQEGIEIIRGQEATGADGSHISSSAIRKLLSDGFVEKATEALGRPHSLTGTVVNGHHLGRKIGFPTANILPADPKKIIPATGAYACIAVMPDGNRMPSMVNIGSRPTVNTDTGDQSIEAHIIGFNGNLYGSVITLEFIGRLRDEMRFSNVTTLSEQLKADKEATLSRLSAL